jgi:hypothetical protein
MKAWGSRSCVVFHLQTVHLSSCLTIVRRAEPDVQPICVEDSDEESKTVEIVDLTGDSRYAPTHKTRSPFL